MKEHFLIRVLEWAEPRIDGFTAGELLAGDWTTGERALLESYLQSARDCGRHSSQVVSVRDQQSIFYVTEGVHVLSGAVKFALTPDWFLGLLDWRAVKTAQEGAIEAKRQAQIALVISIVALASSMLLTVYYGERPTDVKVVELEKEVLRRVR